MFGKRRKIAWQNAELDRSRGGEFALDALGRFPFDVEVFLQEPAQTVRFDERCDQEDREHGGVRCAGEARIDSQ